VDEERATTEQSTQPSPQAAADDEALHARTSRTGAANAGWGTDQREEYVEPVDQANVRPQIKWLTLRTLLETRNDVIAKFVRTRERRDFLNDERQRWVAAVRSAGVDAWAPDLVLSRSDLGMRFSFLVTGDPGEGDASQYVTVAPLLSVGVDTDFMVVLSDVIYPAGDVNQYVDAFYKPYEHYDRTIYGVPGNHDWYALLEGFMYHFCGIEPLPRVSHRATSYSFRERLARAAWLQSAAPKRAELLAYRDRRPPWRDRQPGQPQRPPQPGPYFALDTPSIRLVCIDTGIGGTIDAEQGVWFERVSLAEPEKPKILLTGKPIFVDGKMDACKVEWAPGDTDRSYRTVEELVRRPEANYIAAIGGDVHNYQRYPVTFAEDGAGERTIQYVVSGGGGAHLSATHPIAKIDGPPDRPPSAKPVRESDFRCYPLRGDSLARYTRTFGSRLLLMIRWLLLAGLVLAGAAAVAWWLLPLLPDRFVAIVAAAIPLAVVAFLVVRAWLRLRIRLALLALTVLGAALLDSWTPPAADVETGVRIALTLLAAALAIAALVATLWLLWIGRHVIRRGEVSPDAAARYVGELLGMQPERRQAREVETLDRSTRRKLNAVFPPSRKRGFLYGSFFSGVFDFNDAPFFKSFLRVDVGDGELKLTCYGVSGFSFGERHPPIEDSARWTLADGWTTARAILAPHGESSLAGEAEYYAPTEERAAKLVLDLRNAVGDARYRVFMRAERGEGDWQFVTSFVYDGPGTSVPVDLEPPARGWFKAVALAVEGGRDFAAVGAFL
jgi:Calcineurin-like phosphoesterase